MSPEERRRRTLIADGLGSAFVHLSGRDTRDGHLRDPVKCLRYDEPGRSHADELIRGLDLNAIARAKHGQPRIVDRMRSETAAMSPMPSMSTRMPRSR